MKRAQGNLSVPAITYQTKPSNIESSLLTSPLLAAYTPKTVKFDERAIKDKLFRKTGNEEFITFSKYFATHYSIGGSIISKQFIPKLSDQDIVKLLKKMRNEVGQFFATSKPFDITLPEKIADWPYELLESIMANVLLGPYIYNEPRSGKKYIKNQDVFDFYEPPPGYEGKLVNSEPIENRLLYFDILFYKNNITAALKPSMVNEFTDARYYSYSYKYPTEVEIVNYLRFNRFIEASPEKLSTKFILYHNLLVPYIFP